MLGGVGRGEISLSLPAVTSEHWEGTIFKLILP